MFLMGAYIYSTVNAGIHASVRFCNSEYLSPSLTTLFRLVSFHWLPTSFHLALSHVMQSPSNVVLNFNSFCKLIMSLQAKRNRWWPFCLKAHPCNVSMETYFGGWSLLIISTFCTCAKARGEHQMGGVHSKLWPCVLVLMYTILAAGAQ